MGTTPPSAYWRHASWCRWERGEEEPGCDCGLHAFRTLGDKAKASAFDVVKMDRAAVREAFVEIVRYEYPNAGDGIIGVLDSAFAATPDAGGHLDADELRLAAETVGLTMAVEWWREVVAAYQDAKP